MIAPPAAALTARVPSFYEAGAHPPLSVAPNPHALRLHLPMLLLLPH
jgi:hypothetical protein